MGDFRQGHVWLAPVKTAHRAPKDRCARERNLLVGALACDEDDRGLADAPGRPANRCVRARAVRSGRASRLQEPQ